MFGLAGNSPVIRTDSLVEFLLWQSITEAENAGNCRENMTVGKTGKNNALF